jgi:hypothetical protein
VNRREFLLQSGAVVGGIALGPILRASELLLEQLPIDERGRRYAEGFVFHDVAGSDRRGPGSKGIAGVCVSNGREVVRTGQDGKWRLPVNEDSTLFVIKPSGWMTPVDRDGIPRYYYVHRPNGSPDLRYGGVAPTGELPASIDFPLLPQREDRRFRIVLFGDPQPRNLAEVDYIAYDVVEQVARDAAAVDAKFGISLGDIMFDDLSLYGRLNGVVGTVGLPWYNVHGNHDLNFDAVDDERSAETWHRVYGPNYYAFDYARVHFIVLDDVVWNGRERGNYHGEITKRQLEFVRNDLAFVPRDRLVVVCMHIPITGVNNREELYRLIEDRPYTLSLSAHTHVQAHRFLGREQGWRGAQPHHHLNHATVCGCWWQGAPDERGIPHATMADGGPNGYSIVEFDGHKYKVTFRAASRPESDQMAIFAPGEVGRVDLAATEVVVNVWAGSERSVVAMRAGGGDWRPMTQFEGQDPGFLKLKELETGPVPPPGLKLPGAARTRHLWKAALPAELSRGTHAIEVRTTDMFGQTYTGRRVIRVA